jgi:hypothetical protein
MNNTTFKYAGKLEEHDSNKVHEIAMSDIKPSPENDLLYRPYDRSNPENLLLAQQIQKEGVLEPLVLSQDYFILSGHRRFYSAKWVGLESIPCRFDEITRSSKGDDAYIARLRHYNTQRVKTVAEMFSESVIDTDKKSARRQLVEIRQKKQQELKAVGFIEIEGEVKRSKITYVKEEMASAALKAVDERRDFWPLSVRSIHYALLNDPPLRNCGKNPKMRILYENNKDSYNDLCNLCMRLRLCGRMDWNSINDETRPFDLPRLDATPASFIRREMDWFLTDFRRDLLQSQPHHIEIVGEKNTVRSTLKPIADKFGVPLTTARGFSSATPRLDVSQRYRKSGKDKLIILTLTDLDPCGDEIAHSFLRSLRDDFGIPKEKLELLKVAINLEQVERFSLPKLTKAKQTDKKSAKYEAKHGAYVWELEALPLPVLQTELQDAIEKVIDLKAFQHEVDIEDENAIDIDRKRQMARLAMGQM